MKCKFQAGDKVVCVDASRPSVGYWRGDALCEGSIYTVACVYVDVHSEVGLMLVEVSRNAISLKVHNGVAGYYARRFRPAEDIEQFRRLCTNLPVDAELVE